jgi:hypothetical protein
VRERELADAREQQAATGEVLEIISSSPGELEPVFTAVLANAVRLCAAKFGTMWLAEGGDRFRSVAFHGTMNSRRYYSITSSARASSVGGTVRHRASWRSRC